MKNLIFSLPLFLFLISCADPQNPNVVGTTTTTTTTKYIPPPKPVSPTIVQPPKPVFEPVRVEPAKPLPAINSAFEKINLQGEADPKLDILFVIDTSQSMECDQINVVANINKFVDIFTRNNRVDFHIGVTSVWDSKSYGDGRAFKNGELRPVYGQAGQRFVTRQTQDIVSTMKKTLSLKVEPLQYLMPPQYLNSLRQRKGIPKDVMETYHVSTLHPYGDKNPATTGPESEEAFSPIFAALTDSSLQDSANKGFRREDADLAIVIITDADDLTPSMRDPSKPMFAEDAFNELRQFETGNSHVTVLAALARLDQMRTNSPAFGQRANATIGKCDRPAVDPDIAGPFQGPERIFKLTQLTGGDAFDLQTTKFGDDMAKLGQNILLKSVSREIPLKEHMVAPGTINDIRVTIDNQAIPKDDVNGWSYEPSSNKIILNKGLNLTNYKNYDVNVTYKYRDIK